MKFRAIRSIRKIGRAVYVVLPPIARREMRLMVNDYVQLELDTDARTLTIAPVHLRNEIPQIHEHRASSKMHPVDPFDVSADATEPGTTPTLKELDQ